MIQKAPILEGIQNIEGMPYGEPVRDYYHIHYMKEFVKWLKENTLVDNEVNLTVYLNKDAYESLIKEVEGK